MVLKHLFGLSGVENKLVQFAITEVKPRLIFELYTLNVGHKLQ